MSDPEKISKFLACSGLTSVFKENVLSIQGALEFSWRLEFRGGIQGGGRAPHVSYNSIIGHYHWALQPLKCHRLIDKCELHMIKILTEIFSDKILLPEKNIFLHLWYIKKHFSMFIWSKLHFMLAYTFSRTLFALEKASSLFFPTTNMLVSSA